MIGMSRLLRQIEQETYETEKHFHSNERWFGLAAAATGTHWGDAATLLPYRAISGLGVFGADANDEALVIGTDDMPNQTGMTLFDTHRILVTAASNATDWILRCIHGSSDIVTEEGLGNYSDIMVQEARKGFPLDEMMPRMMSGTDKIWIRAMNATDNATIDFFVGVHEYER